MLRIKFFSASLMLLVLLVLPAVAYAGQHVDTYGCKPCHVPHHAAGVDDPTNDVPLWSGRSSGNSYTLYADVQETLDSMPEQPQGSSKLCLSCHDGTNEIIGEDMTITIPGVGTFQVPRPSNFGTDLRDMHPVSIVYDDAFAATAGEFKDPSTITGGYVRKGTDGKYRVQCASCHDVHDGEGAGFKLLRGGHQWYDGGNPLPDGDGSTGGDLCLECHVK